MKKRQLTCRIAAMVLCCMAWAMQMQGATVTVGTTTATTSYFPVNPNWDYTYSETVYAADDLLEVGNGNKITSLSWIGTCTIAGTAESLEVYLSNTSMSSVSARTDLSTMTKVYDGPVSINVPEESQGAILSIDFDEEFTYAGANLHIVTIARTPSVAQYQFCYQRVTGACGFASSETNFWTGSSYGYFRPVVSLEVTGDTKPTHSVTVGSAGNYDCQNYGSPLDLYYSNHSISETLYTAEELGIEANQELHSIAYKGWTSASDNGETFAIKVWMENTEDGKYDANNLVAADVSKMTKVYDNTITIPAQGSYGNYANIVNLDFGDNGFVYTGKNLRVVIQCDNEATKNVYWAYDSSKANSSIYAGSENNDPIPDKRTLYAKGMPVTVFTYSEAEVTPPIVKTPEITLTTSMEIGQMFGLTVYTSMADDGTAGGMLVDWGDGSLMEYPFSGTVSASNNLKGNTVKVYSRTEGLGILWFDCHDGMVTDVTIDAPDLNTLNLSGNLLPEIDLSACPKLEQIVLERNQLISFDYTGTALKYLNLRKNAPLERLTISSCTNLEHLDIGVNRLREAWMELPSATNLSYLDISYNRFNSLSLSNYPNLETLICSGNSLSTLNLANKSKLKKFVSCYQNMSSISFSDCPDLEYVDLSGTSVSDLNLTKNPKLQELYLKLSSVTNLNLSANTELKRLDISECGFTELDLSANKTLEYIDYSSNSMPNLDLSNNSSLTYVDCSNNGVTELNLSNAPMLKTLISSRNKLTSFDASAYTNLEVVDCSSNYIKQANISGNAKLVNVNFADNELTGLDVEGASELAGLNISTNQFDKAALETLFYNLPDINNLEISKDEEDWKGIIGFKGNPGADEANVELLEIKGWKYTYNTNVLGDASGAIVLPERMVNTHFGFSVMTNDETFFVDWGDGKKVEYVTETYPGAYTNPDGVVEGTVIKIYSPGLTLLATSNNAVDALILDNMTELESLSCESNNISELDLSNNPKLSLLYCGKNPLTTLLLPENSVLTTLSCENTLLKSIDLSKLQALETLRLDENRLQQVDLTSSTKLKYLSAYKNELASIDLSRNTELEELYLSYNELTGIDLSHNTKLKNASISHNKLKSFDASALKSAQYIFVTYNEISELTLDNPSLIQLGAGSNKPLSDVDLSKCPDLKILDLSDCNLTEVDYSANTQLQWLFVGNNSLSSIIYPDEATGLTLLSAANNKLESVDYSKMPNIDELVLRNNRISGEVDLSANSLLTYLDLSSNSIDRLKLSETSALEALYIQYNNLTTLSVPSSVLAVLDATRNNLQAINISQCSGLRALFLDFNNLNMLNLDGKSNLLGLSIRRNNLSEKTLNDIYESLPDISGVEIDPEYASWMAYLFISGNPGTETSNVEVAQLKGWNVVLGEELPVLRNITFNVHSAKGEPLSNATFTLILDGEEFSMTPSREENGTYVFEKFEVFLSLQYQVRVEHPEYVSKVVDVEGIDKGDVTVDVELDENSGIENVSTDPALSIRGGIGCIEVTTDRPFTLLVYDMSGRLITTRPVEEGKTVVDGIVPGLYITNGTKVIVR